MLVFNGSKVKAEYLWLGEVKYLQPRETIDLPEMEARFVADAAFTYDGVEVPQDVVCTDGTGPAHAAATGKKGEVLRHPEGRPDEPKKPQAGEVVRAKDTPPDPCGAWDLFVAAHPTLQAFQLEIRVRSKSRPIGTGG